MEDIDPLPAENFWHENVVMWGSHIDKVVREDLGGSLWEDAERKARDEKGFTEGVKRKNSLLITATLEQLSKDNVFSAVLDKLCDQMLSFSEGIGK